MKNLILIITFFICFQQIGKSQIYVGAKVGISPSFINFENDANHISQLKIGQLLGGIMVEIPVYYGFSIQPEFQFVQKGTRLKAITKGSNAKAIIPAGLYYSDYLLGQTDTDSGTNDNGVADETKDKTEIYSLPNLYENIKISTNYLEGMLLFKYEFMGGNVGFYTEVGTYYDYGLSAKGTGKLVDDQSNTKSNTPLIQLDGNSTKNYTDLIKSHPLDLFKLDFDPFSTESSDRQSKYRKSYALKNSDFGAVIGGGIYMELGESRMYVDLRYLHGLININQLDLANSKVFNRDFQLSLTYLFPLGG